MYSSVRGDVLVENLDFEVILKNLHVCMGLIRVQFSWRRRVLRSVVMFLR
jgi:hypothetical protein